MYQKYIVLILIFFMLGCGANLSNDKGKKGYAVGLQIGRNMKNTSDELDPQAVALGIVDGMTGQNPRLKPVELQAALKLLQKTQEAKVKTSADKIREASLNYINQNKRKPGVNVTGSGLQFEILESGKGKRPRETDTVLVRYIGRLVDGTEFANTKKGEPVALKIRDQIPGWREGLQLMKIGSSYRFSIPPELAYGSKGTTNVPPDSALILEVDLLKIEKHKK